VLRVSLHGFIVCSRATDPYFSSHNDLRAEYENPHPPTKRFSNNMMAKLASTFLLAVATSAASEMCISDTGVYTVNVDLFAGELGKLLGISHHNIQFETASVQSYIIVSRIHNQTCFPQDTTPLKNVATLLTQLLVWRLE
jgi:hypothetical protein